MRLLNYSVVVAALVGIAGCGARDDTGGDDPTPDPPEPVVAPMDFFAIGAGTASTGSGDTLAVSPDQAFLVGPYGAVALASITTTTVIDGQQAAALHPGEPTVLPPTTSPSSPSRPEPGLRAADGHEFLIVRTTTVPERPRSRLHNPEDVQVELAIQAGEQTYWIGDVEPDTLADGGLTLVMSVPQGEDVVLTLEDAGRTQSLDLRTGERGDDAIDLYYSVRAGSISGTLEAQIQLSGVLISEGPVVIEGELTGGSLYPYRPGLGWAEPGRAWLRISPDSETWTFDGLIQPLAEFTLDTAASFTVTGNDGEISRAEPDEFTVHLAVSGFREGARNDSLIFDVSEDFRTGSLGFAPQGIVKSGDQEGTVSTSVPSEPVAVELSG